MLAALRDRICLRRSVAIVVAHPDDETIAAGGSLHLLPELLLVHVTDGAPRGLGDAARQGFTTSAAYGAARQAELAAALALAGSAPVRASLDVPDQEASLHVAEIAAGLAGLFRARGVGCVLTHAYEGGHPDHDAVALAVHLAGVAEVIEFAGYHAAPDGALILQRFLGDTGTCVALPPRDAGLKRAMLDCFRTQADILSRFDAAHERFRPAPRYDFAAPPHPGPLNYERWGWEMTGARWRSLAAAAMERVRCDA